MKLKVKLPALEIRNAETVFKGGPKLIRLSLQEAVNFQPVFSSFEEMSAAYGAEKILKPGVYYNGYAAVFHWKERQELVRMDGILQRVEQPGPMWTNSYLLKACQKGWLYKVVMPQETKEAEQNEKEGKFRFVWNFQCCDFAGWMIKLLKRQQLPARLLETVSDDEFNSRLKNKIIQAQTETQGADFTDDEILVLKSYVGETDYYPRFFYEVN